MLPPDDALTSPVGRMLAGFLDPAWYLNRYPDLAGGSLDPYQHFVRFGATEARDPNPFFDTAWYVEHYPDVSASGLVPLLHYARFGAAELRNPHPHFDAVYYVQQHPDAAVNPLLYHLRVGSARGYPTERAINIEDYLPSEAAALPVPRGVFADVVIPVHRDADAAMRCIRSVLADRAFPLARVIVVDDRSPEPALVAWLRELADEGQIYLIRNQRRLGFAQAAQVGIDAAETHDVVLLNSDTDLPTGWVQRLSAHAYAQPNVATVSPLWDRAAIGGRNGGRTDAVCRTVNAGRSAETNASADHCVYMCRAALAAFGRDCESKSRAAGWHHLAACDTFVGRNENAIPEDPQVAPFRFAATAALFRESGLPVILMISHDSGGGVKRHIDSLVQRYQESARFLLLQGSDRGAVLSVAGPPDHPVLTLPADRLDDLVTLLRSAGVSRIHIHHLLHMDMDVHALVHRLGVPFDVTVHDYYAICPQVNLLRWEDGLYCGEPGPAACNACIADQSSHGARDIVSWRRDWAWQFMQAERVICPSADVKRRLDRYGLGERAFVVPHEQQTEPVWATRVPAFDGGKLRIALLGVLSNHKGARAVAEVAESGAAGAIELHLIGHLEPRFPQPARKLIKATGKYQEADLPALLARIDPHVFWLPSSCPETYSFTLSTAIATGLPIVATDIGSFSERLAGRPQTWLVDHRASAQDWLGVFNKIRDTLGRTTETEAVARPQSITDFYQNQYLAAPVATPAQPRAHGKPRIAIVPERFATGGLTPCAYIRLLQPLDHPAIGGGFDIILANAETIFRCDADIIVTQRHAIPDVATANRLADHARRTGARLLYDLDDDLLSVPVSHPDAAALRPFAATVRRMLTVADAVWVSTTGLAERLASIRPDAVVIENRLDERIWVHAPRPDPAWDNPVRILCMGTSTHDRDFAMIEPALLRLKAEYGGQVAIDVLGMTTRSELPPGLDRIGPPTHASRSYPGFVNWLTTMQPGWHIALAPLLDTPFNTSKSPIKAMDYAALGITVLASDTPVYRGSIADGPAGTLVANDVRHWHAALDWLVRDQALRAAAGAQARTAFLDQGTLASQAAIRLTAWQELLDWQINGRNRRLRDTPMRPTMLHGTINPLTRKRRHRG